MYSGRCQRAQGQRLSGPRATLRGADVPWTASHCIAVDGTPAAVAATAAHASTACHSVVCEVVLA